MSTVDLGHLSKRASRTRALQIGVLAVALLASLVAAGRLYQVHRETGEWTLVASAAPTRITFSGRDYDRGTRQALPTGWVAIKRTPGGGVVYSSPDRTGTPVLLFVRDGDKTWAYGLVGGP